MNRASEKAIKAFISVWDARFFIFAAILIAMASSVHGETCSMSDANANLSVTPCESHGNGLYSFDYRICNNYFKTLTISANSIFGKDIDSAVLSSVTTTCNTATAAGATYQNCSRILTPLMANYSKQKISNIAGTDINPGACLTLNYVYGSSQKSDKFNISILGYDKGALISNFTLDPAYNATIENLWMQGDFNNTGINATGVWTSSCPLENGVTKIYGSAANCSVTAQRFNYSFATYDIATTQGAVTAWIYPTANNIDSWFYYNQLGTGAGALGAYYINTGKFQQYIGAYSCAQMTFAANAWMHLAMTWDKGTVRCYYNGTMIDSATGQTGTILGNNVWGSDWISGGRTSKSYFNDVRVYLGKNLTSENITFIYNSSAGTPYPLGYVAPAGNPTIAFDKQVPANITISGVLSKSVNISYNYTLISPNNLTNAILYYNMTTGDGKPCIFVNGTIACGNFNTTSISNTSTTITFRLFDASILPATYNFPERDMEQTIHINSTMQDYLKINLNNISSTRSYGFFEIMATNTSGAILPIYFCNSSYSSGKPETDPNCGQFGSIDPKPYDHIHSIYSAHHVIPFVVANGTIAGVGVTSKGSFIMPGSANWIFMYISNVSRANATMLSNNQGNTFTSVIGTADAHLHQFDPGNDSITYYACINQTNGMGICSTPINSLVGLSALPPSAPVVISPTNGTYNVTMLINYTASASATGYILYYGIGLEDSNHNPVYTIIANNSLALTYNFNTSLVANGQYYAIVTAFDNQSLNTTGESSLFTISNYIPPTPIATGDAITAATTNALMVLFLIIAVIAYFLSLMVPDGGSVVLRLISLTGFVLTKYVATLAIVGAISVMFAIIIGLLLVMELVDKSWSFG